MGKLTRFIFGILAALFALTSATMLAGALWFGSNSFESKEFTQVVEAALTSVVPKALVRVKNSVLSWDNKTQTIDLACEEVSMVDGNGDLLASFPTLKLKVSLWSLLRGRVLPHDMTSNEARFWLTRGKDGSLSLGAPETDNASVGTTDAMPLIAKIADELAHESLKHQITIGKASVFIKDELFGQKVTLHVPTVSIVHEKGSAKGDARIEIAGKNRPFYAQVTYGFDVKESLHRLGLSFQDIRPSSVSSLNGTLAALSGVDLPFSGTLSLVGDKALRIVDSSFKISASEGTVFHPVLWSEPQQVHSVVVEGGFDNGSRLWVLRSARIDFAKAKLLVEGEAKAPPNNTDFWSRPRNDDAYRIHIVLTDLSMADFGSFWPQNAVPNARAWMVPHMSKGIYKKGEVTVRGHLDWKDLTLSTLDDAQGTLEATGADVLYLDGMPPVTGVDAKARFDLKGMDIQISGGVSGDLSLKPFTIRMSGFEQEIQTIVIPVKLAGPVRAVIARIKGPPLKYAERFGLEPDDMDGVVEGTLSLKFPLLAALNLQDVDINATAKIKDFSATNLVPGLPITDGQINLTLNGSGMSLNGPLHLKKIPLNVSWKTSFLSGDAANAPLHQGTLVGSIDGAGWKTSGLLDGVASVSGVTPLTLHYSETADGYAQLEGEVSLRQASLYVIPLNWAKSDGAHGRLMFEMNSAADENVFHITKFSLNGVGAQIEGLAALDKAAKNIVALNLDPFIVGRSDAKITIAADDAGVRKITVRGKALDLSGQEENGNKEQTTEKTTTERYDVKLDQLYTGAKSFVSDLAMTAERDVQGWKEILFRCKAQAKNDLSFTLDEKNGILYLSAATEDFGVALEGLGLTNGVRGGRMTITGASTNEDPRKIKGSFKVNEFQVTDAPFLARLFSAVSPFGFADLVTGRSSFDRMKGEFVWEGDKVEIKDLRAPGSVAGINLDGKVDFAADKVDLRGTVVPFSFFNSILSSIPLIGDVITGGKGVIAAAFTVKGTLAKTELSVNPVSLLTPGFLRNLFFSGGEEEEK